MLVGRYRPAATYNVVFAASVSRSLSKPVRGTPSFMASGPASWASATATTSAAD